MTLVTRSADGVGPAGHPGAHGGPPQLWSVLDEGVLHRLHRRSTKVMHDQLEHLADLAENPPEPRSRSSRRRRALTAVCWASFVIADLDGSPGMVYLETAAEGQIADSPAIRGSCDPSASISLRSEALPRAASRDLIMEVAAEKWT